MFEMDLDGYLTSRIEEIEVGIEDNFAELFQGCKRINHECHVLLDALRVDPENPREVLVATLFMRCLEHYQASIILFRRGMVAGGNASLRAVLESAFRLRAIARDTEMWKTFLEQDVLYRRKLLRKLGELNLPAVDNSHSTIPSELENQLSNRIRTDNIKEITTEKWSKTADMHGCYLSTYTLVSHSIHSGSRDLEGYLVLDDDENLAGLAYGRSLGELRLRMTTAAEVLLLCASSVDDIFGLDFAQKKSELDQFIVSSLARLDDEIAST